MKNTLVAAQVPDFVKNTYPLSEGGDRIRMIKLAILGVMAFVLSVVAVDYVSAQTMTSTPTPTPTTTVPSGAPATGLGGGN